MNLKLLFRAFALVVATATFASAQTLAEVAKKEEERRKTVKQPVKVIKNEDLKPVRTSAAPPPPAATPAPADAKPAQPAGGTAPPADPNAPAASAAGQAKPAGTDAAAAEKKDETYWRNRITAARMALQRNRVYVDAMQSRINALTTDFVNRDDPAQKAVIAGDRQKALAELDRLKKEIDDQTKEIAKIEEEARRAGVPPGWLR